MQVHGLGREMFQADGTIMLPAVHHKNRRRNQKGAKEQKGGSRSGEKHLVASKEGKELVFIKGFHIYHHACIISFNPLNSSTPILLVRILRIKILCSRSHSEQQS